jgi:hypothetical protein
MLGMPGSLLNVEHKIFRAAQHFQYLTTELEGYFKTNPGHLVAEQQTNPDEITARFQAKGPIPARIPIIMGDFLQNLRSSLDYLVRELVLAANNQPTNHEIFPICDTPKGFKEAVRRGQLTGIPTDAHTLIEGLQPYHLGQDLQKSTLWILNEFTNINKHRRILVTVLRGGESKTNLEIFNIEGEPWTKGPMPSFDENTKLGPFPVNTKGQVEMNVQVFAVVTFDEGPTKGMEITSALNGMAWVVKERIVPRFERFYT